MSSLYTEKTVCTTWFFIICMLPIFRDNHCEICQRTNFNYSIYM